MTKTSEREKNERIFWHALTLDALTLCTLRVVHGSVHHGSQRPLAPPSTASSAATSRKPPILLLRLLRRQAG